LDTKFTLGELVRKKRIEKSWTQEKLWSEAGFQTFTFKKRIYRMVIMNTEIPNIEGISVGMLSRYVEMRRSIDAEAKIVHSFSSMLALLQQCGDDRIDVDPVALGHVNEMISNSILNIREILDNFIYIVQAQLELEKLGNYECDS